MALDIVDIRNKVINLLDKNNDTTSSYDISANLAVRVGSVTAGNPEIGHPNTQFPVVFVDIYEHREELELLGLGSHQKTQFNVDIWPVTQWGVGQQNGQAMAEDEMLQITENINNLLRAKPDLSITGVMTNSLGVDFSNIDNSTYVKQSKITVDTIKYAKSDLQVPVAPSGLTATGASDVQINLTWVDNSIDETGFEIQRKSAAVGYAIVGTAAADATTFNDTGLSATTEYTYKVRAYSALGYSGFTNEATATTQASALLYSNDFNSGTEPPDNWPQIKAVGSGTFTIDSQQGLLTKPASPGIFRYSGGSAWTDYTFQFDLINPGLGRCNFLVRCSDQNNYINVWYNGGVAIYLNTLIGGGFTNYGSKSISAIATGSALKIKVEDVGATTEITVFDDNVQIALWTITANAAISDDSIAFSPEVNGYRVDNLEVRTV